MRAARTQPHVYPPNKDKRRAISLPSAEETRPIMVGGVAIRALLLAMATR